MHFNKSKIEVKKSGYRNKINGYRMSCDLYHCNIDVIIGNRDEMLKYNDNCGGFLQTSEDGINHLIWLGKKELKTLVHETYHLVNRIAKRCDLSEDWENEQQAYLMGWLFEEIRKLKQY